MLEVEALSKRFGGLVALTGVDFSVNSGEILSLIGPNGAGKTTCLNLVTGFIRPSAGRVRYEGADITGALPHRIAQRGLIRSFQKTNVLKGLSVFENVLTAGHRHGVTSLWRALLGGRAVQRSEQALRDEAAEVIAIVGLEERMQTEAGSLSCGELRLLELAIALGARPKLLMLDEPAAGLNTTEAKHLGEVLQRLVRTRVEAILLVEHNMSLVMSVSDRLVVLNFGRKIAEGAPESVRNDPEVIAAYLGKAAA